MTLVIFCQECHGDGGTRRLTSELTNIINSCAIKWYIPYNNNINVIVLRINDVAMYNELTSAWYSLRLKYCSTRHIAS